MALYGPGTKGPHSLARKLKIDAKNLRLNGEFVDGPRGDPTRYDELQPGDFAVIEFLGDPFPDTVNVDLVSAANPGDAALHAELTGLLPRDSDSMRVLSEEDVAEIVERCQPAPAHPIWQWLDGELLEEVGQGHAEAARRLNARRQGRGLTTAQLAAAKQKAEQTGRLGEQHLNAYLSLGHAWLADHEWVADSNAISPFDFWLSCPDGTVRHADAKSTTGKFDLPIFLSLNELRCAVEGGAPYDIYRLYHVTETGAKLRIARNVGPTLTEVLARLAELPTGVTVDTLSIAPAMLPFDTETIELEFSDEDDEQGELGL